MARALGLVLGVVADEVLPARASVPGRAGHPVTAFGEFAARLERRDYRDNWLAGALHASALTGAAIGLGVLVERIGARNPLLRTLSTTALGGALDAGEVTTARERLPRLSPWRPDELDLPALARAGVEGVAAHTSDAVVAPLFWGALAGAPGLLGYRVLNTLDAMIGNRSPRYRRYGMVTARLDDIANLIPSRLAAALTAASAPVVGGSAGSALRTWRLDAGAHPSPNAGQVEAAFAGALEIRLGGRTVYAYGVEDRPVLGDGRSPDSGHVTRAVELSRVTGWTAAAVCALLSIITRRKP